MDGVFGIIHLNQSLQSSRGAVGIVLKFSFSNEQPLILKVFSSNYLANSCPSLAFFPPLPYVLAIMVWSWMRSHLVFHPGWCSIMVVVVNSEWKRNCLLWKREEPTVQVLLCGARFVSACIYSKWLNNYWTPRLQGSKTVPLEPFHQVERGQ